MATISGYVEDVQGIPLSDVDLLFVNKRTKFPISLMSETGGAYNVTLPPGEYVLFAFEEGYGSATSEVDATVGDQIQGPTMTLMQTGSPPTSPPTSPPGEQPDVVTSFLESIRKNKFHNVEAEVSPEEAKQAIGLFSVVNFMLAGQGRRMVGTEEKIDILGVLNLYYGLQEKSLADRIVVANSEFLWEIIEAPLDELAKKLDQLQGDVSFLTREAKRQFNLGTNNAVPGNTRFPALFNRYVALGTDPRLALDIREARSNGQTLSLVGDEAKLQETYDILRDLKSTIVDIVRSLSKYGTTGTRRVFNDWSKFELGALNVLSSVASQRVSEDQDEKNTWAILSTLIGRSREDIIPYVALADHGTVLLRYALDIYNKAVDLGELEEFDASHLVDLFQPSEFRSTNGHGTNYWTDRIRREANYIRRYPLSNWG